MAEVRLPITVNVDFHVSTMPENQREQAMAYIARAIERSLTTRVGSLPLEPEYGTPVREMALAEMESKAIKLRPTSWQRVLEDDED